MRKRILIRADANDIICTGHIMRCLSIAQAFQAADFEVTFLTADHNADRMLENKDVKHICLDRQWNNLEQELPQLVQLLQTLQPDMILVDHYYVTEAYLKTLQKHTKTVYMDDLNAFHYPCNALINYNAYALDWEIYYRRDYENSLTLLLGPQYAPLRLEFQNLPQKSIRERVENVLVSTGGADPVNMAGRLLNLIAATPAFNGMQFHFVVGSLNPNRSILEETAAKLPNAFLHFNVSKMSELMLKCDLAVAAAGSTLYELCACGVPTITYVLADNQIPGAKGFESRGLMYNAGDYRLSPDNTIQSIRSYIQQLSSDWSARQEISTRMRDIVDGNGAARIVQALLTI